MLQSIFVVALGGGIGSALRYLTSWVITRHYSSHFPLATLVCNVVGCLLIGILMGLWSRTGSGSSQLRLLCITGFCGGYTTFSTFALEQLQLLQQHHTTTALLYLSASILLGLAAVALGWYLTR